MLLWNSKLLTATYTFKYNVCCFFRIVILLELEEVSIEINKEPNVTDSSNCRDIFLVNQKVPLRNLLCQIWICHADCITPRYKSQQSVANMKGCNQTTRRKTQSESRLGRQDIVEQ